MSWAIRHLKAEPGFQGRSGFPKVCMHYLVPTLKTCDPSVGDSGSPPNRLQRGVWGQRGIPVVPRIKWSCSEELAMRSPF